MAVTQDFDRAARDPWTGLQVMTFDEAVIIGEKCTIERIRTYTQRKTIHMDPYCVGMVDDGYIAPPPPEIIYQKKMVMVEDASFSFVFLNLWPDDDEWTAHIVVCIYLNRVLGISFYDDPPAPKPMIEGDYWLHFDGGGGGW